MRDYTYYLNRNNKLPKRRVTIKKDLDWWIETILCSLGKRLGFIALILVLFCGFEGYRLFNSSAYFPVKNIVLKGAYLTQQADIEKIMQKYNKNSFFQISPQQLQRELVSLPWVDAAVVTKQKNMQLQIALKERVPKYRWGENQVLDASGNKFSALGRNYANLPEIYGGEGKEQEVISAYQEFIKSFEFADDIGIKKFVLTPSLSWELYLENGVTIKFGREDLDSRIKRFSQTYQSGNMPDFAEVDVIDLRYSYGFAVKWKTSYLDRERKLQKTSSML